MSIVSTYTRLMRSIDDRWLGTLLLLTLAACSSDQALAPDDSGTDVTAQDTSLAKDSSSKKDSSGADSSIADATADADDGSTADADDGSTADADDGSTVDASDGGNLCSNILCKKGTQCCNIQSSIIYGKCYSSLCLACCK